MITLHRKEDCCGCHACATACPAQCITMREDEEGFLYPETDPVRCIECNLCKKVCPVLNPFPTRTAFPDERKTPMTYAAKSKDEHVREESSSGGIFTELAEAVIRDDGVVFGVRWNEDFQSVVFDYTERAEGLSAFRGSKYLQAVVGDVYQKVRRFLVRERKVLFTGTPCQIAGLRRFLRKDYENLFTAEVVCHGVPPAKVWRLFLAEQTDRIKIGGKEYRGMEKIQRGSLRSPLKGGTIESVKIEDISFRRKILPGGWKKFSYVLSYLPARSDGKIQLRFVQEQLHKNVFMRAFLSDICLRPSCYECPSKGLKSPSDISLGDFWGVRNHLPEMDDNKGTSLVCVNTCKGMLLWERILTKCRFIETEYANGTACNPALEHSPKRHAKRTEFFKKLSSGARLHDFVFPITRRPLKVAVRGWIFAKAYAVLRTLGVAEPVKRFLRDKNNRNS